MKNAGVDATVAKAVVRNFKFIHKKIFDFCILEKIFKRLQVGDVVNVCLQVFKSCYVCIFMLSVIKGSLHSLNKCVQSCHSDHPLVWLRVIVHLSSPPANPWALLSALPPHQLWPDHHSGSLNN